MKQNVSAGESAFSRYARLTPPFRMLLQLFALTGGLSRSLLPELIRELGIPAPRGRNWLGTDLRSAEHSLLQLKLIDARGRCCRELEHGLALEAAARAAQALPIARSGGPAHLPLCLRLAVYARDGRAYRAVRAAWCEAFPQTPVEPAGPLDGQFVDIVAVCPDRKTFVQWFGTLSPEMAQDILSSNLEFLFATGNVPSGLVDMLQRLPSLRETLSDSRILLLDILSGRFPEAGSQLAGSSGSFGRSLYGGLIDFFSGRNVEAVQKLREAQKQYRKLTGKRRLPLPGPGGLCFALALIRAENPVLNEELESLLDNLLAQRLPIHKGVLAMHALYQLMQGKESVARGLLQRAAGLPKRDPLAEAIFYAVDRQVNHVLSSSVEEVQTLAGEYRPIMPLVADILDEALGKAADSEKKDQACLESSLPAEKAARKEKESEASQNDTAVSEMEAARTEVGSGMRLGAFLEQRENWERLFDNLEHCLTKTSAPVRRKRLIWLLDPENFRVEAVEQSARMDRKGELSWTPGRTVSLKRLIEQSVGMDWLTEQDRRILATAESERDWSGTRYFFRLPRTIEALVGHPLLFRAGERRPLTLKGQQVELVVSRQTKKGGYLLALSRPLGRGQVQLVETGPDTFTFFTMPEILEQAAELLRDGFEVPQEGASRVLELLHKLDPAIPVRQELAAVEVSAQSQVVVRLRPLGTGLEVSLIVRPFGRTGTPVYAPGEGTREPLAEMDGQTVTARRNFEEELQAARHFVASCPTLRERGGVGPWLLDTLETALQCLTEIQNAPDTPETEWPEGETLRVQTAGPSVRFNAEVQHSREWFSLRGDVSVNESLVVRMTDLLDRMDKAEGRFVPLGNGAFLALTDTLRRQLERLRRLSEPAGRGEAEDSRRIHPLAVGAMQDFFDTAESSMKMDAQWQEMVSRFRSSGARAEVSPLLHAELRDYQYEGFAWMLRLARWGAGACLADDMGLGKTVQTIAVLLELCREGPALIVAPTSVCSNWENELSRFAPTLRVCRFQDAASRTNRADLVNRMGAGDVLVTSYGLLHTESSCLSSREWRMAVFDEAQALKNADTRRARAGRRIRAGFRLVLTGTPIENYLEDLWSLFNIINPGLLGTRQSFQKRFSCLNRVSADTEEGSAERNAARQALKALIRPFILRRTKSEVLMELPPRTEQIIRVDMPDDERAFYEALRRKALDVLDRAKREENAEEEGKRKLTILTELTRLRRACCHPALIDPETSLPGAKLTTFMELVEELRRGGHRALVFSQFVGHLAQIRKALDGVGIRYQYLDGSTPERERRRSVEAFQGGEGLLFLISLKAGGQGLNLTAADYVIHLDPWWNPAVEDQASDRAYRLGQKRPVTIYRLVVRDSVEERILALHRSKRALAADFLEGASVPLSEEELLALFR